MTDNVISWPDDGWYQVQDELTYAEICGGTRSCVVQPGSYTVINHTTGTRWKGINVPSYPEKDPQRIEQLTEQLSEAFELLFLDEIDELEAALYDLLGKAASDELDLIDGSLEGDVRTYACPFGGTLHQYAVVIGSIQRPNFDAVNCRGENYLLSGTDIELRMNAFWFSDRYLSRVSIPFGTIDIKQLDGDYRIDALPNSPTEFNYVTPSGTTGTLAWSAVGFIPVIRTDDLPSVAF